MSANLVQVPSDYHGRSITAQYANLLLHLDRAQAELSPKLSPESMGRIHPFALTRRYHWAQGIAEDRRKASKIVEVW